MSRSVASTSVVSGSSDSGRERSTSGARDRTREDERREEEKPLPRAVEQRHDERRDEASDRDGGLANPECEPALVRAEPPHHSAPASGLDAAAGRTREREQRHQRAVVGSEGRRGEEARAADETDGERGAFAVPVGCEAPGQHRDGEPDPLRREHDADLGQAQVVAVAQIRRHHGDCERDRREAGLGARPGGEHRPPVTRLRYRPKGLIGREPVFTVTLFVSR